MIDALSRLKKTNEMLPRYLRGIYKIRRKKEYLK